MTRANTVSFRFNKAFTHRDLGNVWDGRVVPAMTHEQAKRFAELELGEIMDGKNAGPAVRKKEGGKVVTRAGRPARAVKVKPEGEGNANTNAGGSETSSTDNGQ